MKGIVFYAAFFLAQRDYLYQGFLHAIPYHPKKLRSFYRITYFPEPMTHIGGTKYKHCIYLPPLIRNTFRAFKGL